VRRKPLVLVVAVTLATVGTLVDVSMGPFPGTAVPAGAVLPATGSPADPGSSGRSDGMATPSSADLGGGVSAAATPSPTAAPVPISTGPLTLRRPPTPRGMVADGPYAADPRHLSGYRWPLANGFITSPFGPSPFGALIVNGGRFHDGLDIASFCGDTVMAAHSGLVLTAGRRFDPFIGWIGSLAPHTRRMKLGNLWNELPITVIIDDGDGYRAIYAHLNAVAVKPGQWVRAGQRIGWEGSTGFATGCHLHFGLFSPFEPGRFKLRPDVQHRTKYPRWEIARIDPRLVLPPLRHGRTAGPFPSPTPSPSLGP